MKFCVYLTIYSGNKLPPFYIGSSSIDAVKNGYRGSVGSKKYTELWRYEIENHPELFKCKLVYKCRNRKEAYEKEKEWLKKLSCGKNLLYINQTRAHLENIKKATLKITGKSWDEIMGKEKADERRRKASISSKKSWTDEEYRENQLKKWNDPIEREKLINSMKGKKKKSVDGYKKAALERWANPEIRAKLCKSIKENHWVRKL